MVTLKIVHFLRPISRAFITIQHHFQQQRLRPGQRPSPAFDVRYARPVRLETQGDGKLFLRHAKGKAGGADLSGGHF
jgi:hypothetical protein